MQTAVQASEGQAAYYRTLTPVERLRISNYLNNVAYNYLTATDGQNRVQNKKTRSIT